VTLLGGPQRPRQPSQRRARRERHLGRRRGRNLNAANVEAALAEILDAVEGDHFKGNEANAGQHRTIRIPSLGGTKALILDSNASGTASTRLRIYADTGSIWFTLNASWDGDPVGA
jgi:ribosomal protein L30E